MKNITSPAGEAELRLAADLPPPQPRRHAFARIFRKALSLPADLAYLVSHIPVVEIWLLRQYKRERQKHAAKAIAPSDFHIPLLCELAQARPAMASLAQLGLKAYQPLIDDIGHRLTQEKDSYKALDLKGRQTYLYHALVNDEGYRSLFRFGLEPALLHLAEAYLGTPVAYDGFNIRVALAGDETNATNIWHRDREDRRMFKAVLYLNAVGAHCGPFQLAGSSSQVRRETMTEWLRTVFRRSQLARLNDEAVEDDPITCTGPAGTIVFADTAMHLHRQKPGMTGERFALIYSYFSRVPRNPFYCHRSPITHARRLELIDGLTEAQRDSALWYKSLPLIARLICKSAS